MTSRLDAEVEAVNFGKPGCVYKKGDPGDCTDSGQGTAPRALASPGSKARNIENEKIPSFCTGQTLLFSGILHIF